jgi:hypothetical protein
LASLVHDCERDRCPRRGRGHAAGRGRSGAADRPLRQDTRTFREERQQLNTLDPETADREKAAHEPDRVEVVRRGNRVVKRVQVGGCWFRTLDVDAGIRAYIGPRGAKRFWHGHYSGKAVDHYTGGAIPIVDSASRQEYDLFDDHYDLVCELLGAPPDTAIADKGLSIERAFKKCTSNGTAPVFPWRPWGGDFKRHDHDTHDRHGIPRCKHCGGPTNFVRFNEGNRSRPAEQRNPRIWFDCMVGATPACTKTQSISCSTDWRLLVPLWRTDALYHELKESHATYEAAHDWWRDRYKVAPTTWAFAPRCAASASTACARTPPRSSSGCASATCRDGWARRSATTATLSAASKTAPSSSRPSSRTCASAWASPPPTAPRPSSCSSACAPRHRDGRAAPRPGRPRSTSRSSRRAPSRRPADSTPATRARAPRWPSSLRVNDVAEGARLQHRTRVHKLLAAGPQRERRPSPLFGN